MKARRLNYHLIIVLSFLALTGLSSIGEARSSMPDEEPSWLNRFVDRYFANKSTENKQLDGRALELVSQFEEHSGKLIEVVIVSQVASFSQGWDQSKHYSQRMLHGITKGLQTYTKDSLIRDYLLFDQNEYLDPFALADSERLLRGVDFIQDARIIVFPLSGGTETVAVVVEVQDRWPVGLDGKVIDNKRYNLKLYSENLFGHGIYFGNELLVNRTAEQSVGYTGLLRKENVAGSFINSELQFEDSYRQLGRYVKLERKLAHPGIKLIGGTSWKLIADRDRGNVPSRYRTWDSWLGNAINLQPGDLHRTTSRTMLVPAVRFIRQTYLSRPEVLPDSNRAYHNQESFIAGVTYLRQKYYKTSYLFSDGETEDLVGGWAVKLSGGYQSREFQKRSLIFLQSRWMSPRARGDVVYASAGYGGYLRNNQFEEGQLNLDLAYFTRLYHSGSKKIRLYSRLRYTLGIDRNTYDRLALGGRSGIRGMSDSQVYGNQRLVGNFETRIFTPLKIFGFRTSCFVFSDVGVTGAEGSAPLFKEKFYNSTGFGLRFYNPDLVFPVVQLRFWALTNVDEPGLGFHLKIGNASYPEFRELGARPGPTTYE